VGLPRAYHPDSLRVHAGRYNCKVLMMLFRIPEGNSSAYGFDHRLDRSLPDRADYPKAWPGRALKGPTPAGVHQEGPL